MDEKLEELAARVSVADISSAVAYGLQRALQRREVADAIADKILRYGGLLHFTIEVAPPITKGVVDGGQVIREG